MIVTTVSGATSRAGAVGVIFGCSGVASCLVTITTIATSARTPAAAAKPSHTRRRDGGATESLAVESVRFHRGRPIVALTGVETMDAAEALAGAELRVDPDALQPLPPGSFYHHDLIGCEVHASGGAKIGRVTGVEGAAAGSRLVVESPSGEILIPLVEGICVNVDVPRKQIVVEPPEGLLELNVTRPQRF